MREGVREGGKEGGREGGSKGVREGGKDGALHPSLSWCSAQRREERAGVLCMSKMHVVRVAAALVQVPCMAVGRHVNTRTSLLWAGPCFLDEQAALGFGPAPSFLDQNTDIGSIWLTPITSKTRESLVEVSMCSFA